MNDNKEILDELAEAWTNSPDESMEASDFDETSKGIDADGTRFHFALGYLAAKRKYQPTASQVAMTQEVKTRMTFEEWNYEPHPLPFDENDIDGNRRLGWFAALANVELPENTTGKMFNVKDIERQLSCIAMAGHGLEDIVKNEGLYPDPLTDIETIYKAVEYLRDRLLPKTVELTTGEKVDAVCDKISSLRSFSLEKIVDALTNGKTLDDLCQEYNIDTKRRV